MKTRRLVVIGLVIVTGTAGILGCYSQTAKDVAEGAALDSATGVVSVTGTSFEHHLVLRTGNVAVKLAVTPSDSAALTNLAGVETRVRGRSDDGVMHVASFTALSVDGKPVVDGIIVVQSGRLFLNTLTGMRAVGNPPAKLREMVSARVWIGGPMDTGPNSYGVIVPVVIKP